MDNEYRLAGILVVASAALLIGAGVLAASGLGAGAPPNETIKTTENASLETYDIKVSEDEVSTDDTSVWVQENPNRTETTVRYENRSYVLNEDERDELFEAINRSQFVQVVWDSVGEEAEFKADSNIEIRVNQIYESAAHETPTDEAYIQVSPTDSRLPEVQGTVNLTTKEVYVRDRLETLSDVELEVKDEMDFLEEDDVDTLKEIVVNGGDVSYQIQREFDNPDSLEATTVEASNNRSVEIHLNNSDHPDTTVGLTLDLQEESVQNSWLIMEIDSSNITDVEENDNGTIEFGSG